jgi:hypothetical protein
VFVSLNKNKLHSLIVSFSICRMSSIKKHASGSEKRRKKKHIDEFNALQRGDIHKFFQPRVPSRNIEEQHVDELEIVVWEQHERGTSQENIDINNNVSGHANPPVAESICADEQPFFLSIFMILEIGVAFFCEKKLR